MMSEAEKASRTPGLPLPPFPLSHKEEWPARLSRNKWIQRAVVWGALIVLYDLAALAAGEFFLPRVGQILVGSVELIQEGWMLTLAGSLRQMLVGFGLAAVVGIPVGLVMGMWRVLDYVVGMYVNALFVMSLVALLPVLIIVFGVDLFFRISVVFLFSVFFVILATADGVREVDRGLLWTAASFNAGPVRRFTTVVVPSSLPFIVSGLRLGLANAFSGMILAELWVVRDTGELLLQLGHNRDLPKFFALTLAVTLTASLAAALLKALERRLTPWSRVG